MAPPPGWPSSSVQQGRSTGTGAPDGNADVDLDLLLLYMGSGDGSRVTEVARRFAPDDCLDADARGGQLAGEWRNLFTCRGKSTAETATGSFLLFAAARTWAGS
jgi:hypothetical protein